MTDTLTTIRRQFRLRLRNRGGRNSSGVITLYHRGSLGRKRVYRFINFKAQVNVEGVILSFEYDPNRTASIAFVYYLTGYCTFIIATDGLKLGSSFFSGAEPEKLDEVFSVGAQLTLKLIPIGFIIHSIELEPNGGARLCRSAGTYAVILKKLANKVLIKLPSNWNMWLNQDCFAVLGVVLNNNKFKHPIKKAGTVRNMGFRPVVRGIAKNPVDHPHGGRSNKGQHPTTPWGRLTKGQPTVSRKMRTKKQQIRFR